MPARFQPEINLWEAGIYLIEKPDPVLGDLSSLGGVANLPLEQLANRTVWLKGRLANLSVSVAWVQVLVTVTGPWVAPDHVTQIQLLDAVSGGGGGAGYWDTYGSRGGGGGEGCRVRGLYLTVVPGTTYNFNIGAAGTAGAYFNGGAFDASLIGTDGGATSIDDGAQPVPNVLVSIPGGKAGGNLAASRNADGGLASTVTIGGFTFRGQHGNSGGAHTFAGWWLEGSGGGLGGAYRPTNGVTVDATDGGGGRGGVAAGVPASAGAPGHILFAYPLLTISGNT